MLKRVAITGVLVLLGAFNVSVRAADVAAEDLEPRFNDMVRPFMETYCLGCHREGRSSGNLVLDPYTSFETVVDDLLVWQGYILKRVSKTEMPPKDAKKIPLPEERQKFVAWIEALIEHEAAKKAAAEAAQRAKRGF